MLHGPRVELALPLLVCSMLGAACDDESVPPAEPEPATLSSLSVCEGQPDLGDTWEIERFGMDIQLDAEGNVYLIGSDVPECAGLDEATRRLSEHVTKIGVRGDVRWVRSWQQDYTPVVAVAPSGQSMVLAGEGDALRLDEDGETIVERKNGSFAYALGASSSDFLLAGINYGGAVKFDGVTLEQAGESDTFVIVLDRELAPRLLLHPAASNTVPVDLAGVVALSDGDVVTVHTEQSEHGVTVITRLGAHPWRVVVPLESEDLRLFALADDSAVVQIGTTVARLSSDGVPIWSREYARSLHAEPTEGRLQSVAMHAAAGVDRIVIAFDAYPSAGPLETSAGPIQPDGKDIGFATLDVETGLVESVTLENAPNDQSISHPVLARDGAIVAKLVSTWHDADGRFGGGKTHIVRRRLKR